MTDAEAKALAWATQWEPEFVTPYPPGRRAALVKIFYEHLHTLEATEARHTEEMREQAERFSEAVRQITDLAKQVEFSLGSAILTRIQSIAAPFIIPKPDPLVEAVGDALEGQGMGRPSHTTTEITARLRAAIEARGGKIVWEAGE